MSDLLENPDDRFSHDAAHFKTKSSRRNVHKDQTQGWLSCQAEMFSTELPCRAQDLVTGPEVINLKTFFMLNSAEHGI